MSEGSQQVSGPPMICATPAIKTGPTRIGHLFGDVHLPRTVEAPKLLAVLVGVFLGMTLAAVVPAAGIQKFVFGMTFGGAVGWFVSSYSPLRDESMLTWLGLQMNTLRRQRVIDGKPVIVSVGSAVVGRETLGRVRVHRSAVRVPVGRYDERGVLVSAKNKNLPENATVFGNHVFTRPGGSFAGNPDEPTLAAAPRLQEPPAHAGTADAATPTTPPRPPASTAQETPQPLDATGRRPLTLAERRGSAGAPARISKPRKLKG